MARRPAQLVSLPSESSSPAERLPHLVVPTIGGRARAAVLLLHGGRVRGRSAVRSSDLPVLRVELLRRDIADRLAGEGIATWFLHFRERGWNGDGASAIADARWALDQIATVYALADKEIPIVVVGHSMGGRAAVHVASHPRAEAIVGLAPWLPDGEEVAGFAGKRLLIAHGTWDRATSANESMRYLERAAADGAITSFTAVARVGHAMLRQRRRWNDYVVEAATTARSGA